MIDIYEFNDDHYVSSFHGQLEHLSDEKRKKERSIEVLWWSGGFRAAALSG